MKHILKTVIIVLFIFNSLSFAFIHHHDDLIEIDNCKVCHLQHTQNLNNTPKIVITNLDLTKNIINPTNISTKNFQFINFYQRAPPNFF